MSPIAIGLNLLLAALLAAALAMGWRLNRRLAALRDSQAGFAKAVAELDAAARRAEKGLAELRAAADEAQGLLGERIEKAQALAARLERQVSAAPATLGGEAARPADDLVLEIERRTESRLGALLSSARQARIRPAPDPAPRRPLAPRRSAEDDLFDEPADKVLGARR